MGAFSKIKKAFQKPGRILPYLVRRFSLLQVKRVLKDGEWFYAYKGGLYPAYLNEGNAMSCILDKAKGYCKGAGIDVGAGNSAFPGAVPVYNEPHQNAYKLDGFKDGSLDFVFSSHCLEHLDRWQDALRLWIKKLKLRGVLFLYLPHPSMLLWNPGAPWVGDEHKWIPSAQAIRTFLVKQGVEIIEYTADKDAYWSFYVVGRKIKETDETCD